MGKQKMVNWPIGESVFNGRHVCFFLLRAFPRSYQLSSLASLPIAYSYFNFSRGFSILYMLRSLPFITPPVYKPVTIAFTILKEKRGFLIRRGMKFDDTSSRENSPSSDPFPSTEESIFPYLLSSRGFKNLRITA